MNFTYENSSLILSNCSLKQRVYTLDYLFFKKLSSTYLRILLGPSILLNTLCLFVLTRQRRTNNSTTIVLLRCLAIFDMLSIILKYVRAELNYQSLERQKNNIIIIPSICKIIYVLMNASISIAMWTIVLMSVDRAIAVSYPLKSSIWLTQKRISYICCLMSFILLVANLSFITLSDVVSTNDNRKYCGLIKDSLIVDVPTASVLPIVLITAANIVIARMLRRTTKLSMDCTAEPEKTRRQRSALNNSKLRITSKPNVLRLSIASIASADLFHATKRRTSMQVTRMLLAVTLSLIIFNIPNTIISLFTRIYHTRQLLHGRKCEDVSDNDIKLYKIQFYLSVMQDILSDLPHVVNFFLYCLAGKKFRSILYTEIHNFLVKFHIVKSKPVTLNPTCNTLYSGFKFTVNTKFNSKRNTMRNSDTKSVKSMDFMSNEANKELNLSRQSQNHSRLSVTDINGEINKNNNDNLTRNYSIVKL